MKKGVLYLIPTTIAANSNDTISEQVRSIISHVATYRVENIRTARRFISSLKLNIEIEKLNFEELNKKTQSHQIEHLLSPLMKGEDIGIMSEAGLPGIADPGSQAVEYAHRKGIKVIPLSGPSSIFMALMASGFNGQSFTFHGYLPIEKTPRRVKIKEMESIARKSGQTQLFMDTPYRNNQLFKDLVENCQPGTKISVAADLTGSNEFINTKTVKDWRQKLPDLHKIPAIFSMFS